MSVATQLAREAVELAARRIGQAVGERRQWMRDQPYLAFKFHQSMARSLPRWRWIARAWHKSQERRAEALWKASKDADRCELAEKMDRKVRAA